MGHLDEGDDRGSSARFSTTLDLIASLVSLSRSVKVFSGKWKLIRSKLEELHSDLIDAVNCNSGDNVFLSDLVSSTAETVHCAGDLARKCVDMSYSGKLLMQSDLDVVYSRLDGHSHRLSAIYTAGMLAGGCAIVVSRPGTGENIDGMRFYLQDLLTRIRIGKPSMKEDALASLYTAMAEEESYVRLFAGGKEGAPLLVNLMCSSEQGVREGAVKVACFMMAKGDLCKGIFVNAGAVYHLIRILDGGGSEKGKEEAARGLVSLTESSENVWCVSANGGITVLLKLCCSDSGGGVVSLACGVLRNLAGVEEMKKFMVEEGAVAVVLRLVHFRRECVQVALDLLQAMIYRDEPVCKMVIRDGGIEILVGALKLKPPFLKTVETTFRTIETLCFPSESSISCLIRHDYLDSLLRLLQEVEDSVQQCAQKAALRFSKVSGETRKALGDAGFLPELIRLLGSKHEECRGMAAETISNMASISRNRRKILEDYRNVDIFLQLLGAEKEGSSNKRLLLSIVVSLSRCSVGRRRISCSEYMKNLKSLAEAGVEDAQRIVAALPANKLYRLLIRIWKF